MGNKPHPFSAVALGEVKLLVIPKSDFHDMVTKIPALGIVFTKVLTRRLNANPDEINRKFIELGERVCEENIKEIRNLALKTN